MPEKRYFYDVHCHAMNLSHPSLLAFVKRLRLHSCSVPELCANVKQLYSAVAGGKVNRIMNLLSVMERNLGEILLLMEKDVRQCAGMDGRLRIGGGAYDTVVLTPLMMDFGSKEIDKYPNIYYRKLSRKPIVDQVVDLFNGIKKYREQSPYRLFEIYPFLGLNTKNYPLKGDDTKAGVRDLLDKYFKEFACGSPGERRRKLSEQEGRFDGNVDRLGAYSFAGIKVYPPLGFDPWPEKDPVEFAKVNYLYEFCSTRGIPITTHCNDTGFVVAEDSEDHTSPLRWRRALRMYPDLKLNFAHFGYQEKWRFGLFPKKRWEKIVARLVVNYKNVYADFSCRGFGEGYYRSLRKLINAHPRRDALLRKILFGSDFMINLLFIDSYKEYLGIFSHTPSLTEKEKHSFCSENPERFLFGE